MPASKRKSAILSLPLLRPGFAPPFSSLVPSAGNPCTYINPHFLIFLLADLPPTTFFKGHCKSSIKSTHYYSPHGFDPPPCGLPRPHAFLPTFCSQKKRSRTSPTGPLFSPFHLAQPNVACLRSSSSFFISPSFFFFDTVLTNPPFTCQARVASSPTAQAKVPLRSPPLFYALYIHPPEHSFFREFLFFGRLFLFCTGPQVD